MKHIARMRKIQASGVRLTQHIGEEAAAQAECELTAALEESEKRLSEIRARLLEYATRCGHDELVVDRIMG